MHKLWLAKSFEIFLFSYMCGFIDLIQNYIAKIVSQYMKKFKKFIFHLLFIQKQSSTEIFQSEDFDTLFS